LIFISPLHVGISSFVKSQHGKKNIVMLTHLVGNIKALICNVSMSNF
jgi:hypothetical protein